MSNQKPLVTVMIPTYNQESYIKRTLNSVLEQSYDNIEIIVSDDSPHTKIENIICKYFKDKGIKYIHNKKPLGRVANYHFMLYEIAMGEWVINLDGDDYFEDKYFIQNAINIINKYPDIVTVVGQQKIYNEEAQSFYIPPKIIENNYQIVSGNWLFLNAIFKNIELPHLATLYNRKKAIEKGFYEMDIVSSDRASLFKLIINEKVALMNSYVGVWVHHKNNRSQNMDFKDLFNNLLLYKNLFLYAKKVSKISYLVLFIWKILGTYKNIYGYAIEIIEKRDYKVFLLFVKKLIPFYLIYVFFLLIDIRIYKKIIKV